MRGFTMRENRGGKDARIRTEVLEEFTEHELRVSFFAETDFHTPKYENYNDPLWEGDIVEILLTLGDSNRYLEVEVNEKNALYAVVVVNRDGEGDIAIEKLPQGYVSRKTRSDGELWVTDVIVNLDKLRGLGYNDNEKKINYLRQNFRGEELELFAVSPTLSNSFHKTKAFFNA